MLEKFFNINKLQIIDNNNTIVIDFLFNIYCILGIVPSILTYITPFNPYTNLMRWMLLLSSFYRSGQWSLDKVTCLVYYIGVSDKS